VNVVLVKYYRYKVSGEEKFDTLSQAMHDTFYWWENAQAVAYEMIDGDTVYDIVAIQQYWKDRGWLE
jgi:hypothetical protein